jgi:polysaccharide biosynthesis transport protein
MRQKPTAGDFRAMHMTELRQVLWARRRRFLVVTGCTVLLALAISLILPKTYVGTVAVVVDTKGTDPVTGAVSPGELLPSNLATQLDIIASTRVALKVVDHLHLDRNPAMIEKFQSDTDGQGSIRHWVADKLLNKLQVEPGHESSVISIEFSAVDPDFAALIANEFSEAYVQTNLELAMDPAKSQASWFGGQLQQLRKNLQTAQERLSQYQQTKSLVGTEDRLDVENGKLVEMTSQLVVAQSQMYDAQTRQRQMSQALKKNETEQLPDILGNGLLQSMKGDLARAEAKLAQIAQRYDRNYPERQNAAAEVQTLQAKLAAELDTARGSINQAAQIASQRAVELQTQVDRQKKHILDLKQQRDNADVLQREVEIAQRAYDATSQRASDVRLQSQLNQSTVAVLSPATAPIDPARPKLVLNLVLGAFFGLLLATGLCCIAELKDTRLRDTRSVTDVAGMQILAEIPRPSSKRAVRRRGRQAALAAPVAGGA